MTTHDAGLSKERIEAIAASVRSVAFEDVPCAEISPKVLRALCDMALAHAKSNREGGMWRG